MGFLELVLIEMIVATPHKVMISRTDTVGTQLTLQVIHDGGLPRTRHSSHDDHNVGMGV